MVFLGLGQSKFQTLHQIADRVGGGALTVHVHHTESERTALITQDPGLFHAAANRLQLIFRLSGRNPG